MEYKIYTAAKKQIINIWKYTEEKWGEEQADKYIRGFYESLQKIASTPELWQPVDHENIQNVFYHRYKKHFIFFKSLSSQAIGVISILHESMNLPDRLKDNY